jgi:glycosyltransferase involved in cell wall biosynthesis
LNAIASLRIFAYAKYLAEFGYDVTVLTVKKNDLMHCTEHLDDVSQFRIFEADFFLNRVIDGVNHLRQGCYSESKGFIAVDKLRNCVERLKNYLFGNLFTPEDAWIFNALVIAKRLLSKNDYDIVLSSSGPISTHFIAYYLKKKFPRLLWLADYRDMWSCSEIIPRPKIPFAWVQHYLEKRINGRTDCLITVSQPLKELLAKNYGGDILVVENGFFPEDERVECEHVSFDSDDKIIILHTGTIYKKYDPSPLFVAVRELIEERKFSRNDVEIRFYGDNTYLLHDIITACQVSDIVTTGPRISRRESLGMQRVSKVVLFLGYESSLTKGVLTGKLFEYLISGRPILAVGVSQDTAAGKLIIETGTGYVCGNDTDKIKNTIVGILQGATCHANSIEITKYRRDKLVGKLHNYIADRLG